MRDFITKFIIVYLIVDVIGALMWVLSGQPMPDGFFIGNITIAIIQYTFNF